MRPLALLLALLLALVARAAPAKCVVRLGVVFQGSGNLSTNVTIAAYRTAVAKVNAGDWASGARAPGFALGKGLRNCSLQLVAVDDQSNYTLHNDLVAQLLPQVDAFLIGSPYKAFALGTAEQAVQANKLAVACCLPSDQAFKASSTYLFGLSRPVNSTTLPLLHMLSLSPVQAHIAVVYSTSEQFNIDACKGVLNYTNANVVFVGTMETGDGTLPGLVSSLQQSKATFLFACLEAADAELLVQLVLPLEFDGQFFLTGPSLAGFRQLPGTLYTFTATQWSPALPFSDALLGTSSQFAAALQDYAGYSTPPADETCAAAVSIEILVNGLIQAAVNQTSTNVTQVLANIQPTAAKIIQAFEGTTLFGPVHFNELHRNDAGSTYISQLLPGGTGNTSALALILPSDYATGLPIYPSPRFDCKVRIGLVYHATGQYANLDALTAYQVAINRLNSGRWAGSGQRSAGFSLGSNIHGCTYELVARDDQSNVTLQAELHRELQSQVEFFVGGQQLSLFYLDAEAFFDTSNRISIMCCNPDLNVTSAPYVFSLYTRLGEIAGDLFNFFQLYPNEKLGIITSTTEPSNVEQCHGFANLINQTQSQKPSIVYFQNVASYDVSVYQGIQAGLATSGATVVLACLSTNDAVLLATTISHMNFNAVFYSNGPGLPLFDHRVANSAYTLTSSQWVSNSGYSDDLLGDVDQFAADLASMQPGVVPNSITVAAAVSMEVLHAGLLSGMANTAHSSVVQGVQINADEIAASLKSTRLVNSLMGIIDFSGRTTGAPSDNTNAGSALVVAQLQPQPPNYTYVALVEVLPLQDSPIVFPVPTPDEHCTVTLGLVYAATGAYASQDALWGFQVAIDRINAGAWASGPPRLPGFDLGGLVHNCSLKLIALDDQSDPALHTELVNALALQVDFLLSGERNNGSALADQHAANVSQRLMMSTKTPGLHLTPLPTVFGVSNAAATALDEVIRFLSFSFPVPSIAVIYTSTWPGAVEACTSGLATALKTGVPIAFDASITTGDSAAVLDFVQRVNKLHASFVFSCLELNDAALLAQLIIAQDVPVTGTYTLQGPGSYYFDVQVPKANQAYMYTTAQWDVSLGFTDALLGDSAVFAADLKRYGLTSSFVKDTSCLAAVAIELLFNAIVDATQNVYFPTRDEVLANTMPAIAASLKSAVTSTLLGVVQFNSFRQNFGGVLYTTQVSAQTGVPLLVFPSSTAATTPIYPAPTKDYCVNLLGSPTPLDYNQTSGLNQTTICKAWEDSLRLSTNTGGAVQAGNDTAGHVCSTCLSLYQIGPCYSINAVRDVTLFPYFRPSACGQNSAESSCAALIGNATQVLTVPCDYTPWNSAAGIFSTVFLCVCFAINVGFGIMAIKHRAAKALKFAQVYLVLGFIAGACLVSAFGLVFVGPPTNAACQLRTWLFNLSVTVCLCPLFLKAYRVWRIFENPKLKHLVISNVMLFKSLCAVLLVEILWLAIWSGVSPTQSTCVPVTYPGIVVPIPTYLCANTMSWFAIIAAILIGLYIVTCVVLGLLTLNVSNLFAEKEILFASVNIAIVGGIISFLFFFTNLSMQATTSLVAVGLGWCSTFSVGMLVAPKLYLILFKGEDYTNALAFNKESSMHSTELLNQVNALKDKTQKLSDEVDRLRDENSTLRLKLKMKGGGGGGGGMVTGSTKSDDSVVSPTSAELLVKDVPQKNKATPPTPTGDTAGGSRTSVTKESSKADVAGDHQPESSGGGGTRSTLALV